MPLNEKLLAKLSRHPPKSGRALTYDMQVPGAGERIPSFGVYVTAAGVVAFFLDYRTSHGRQRRYTIARWEPGGMTVQQAREEASRLRVEIRNGADPVEEKDETRTAPTVDDLAHDYLEKAQGRKRQSSLRNDRQMLNKIILPKIASRAVADVTKHDLESLHHSLRETPYRGNRVLALLSVMFTYAMECGWRGDNPCHGIPRFQEDRRERWLTGDEIQRLLVALDEHSDQSSADAIRLLLFTGAREMEILKATWDEFDLVRGIWTRPSHHSKSRRIEHVPLNKATVAVLTRMHESKSSSYLFPGENGDGPRTTIRRPWMQVLKRAGLVTVEEVPGKRRKVVKRYRPAIRLHDLRHSFASHLVNRGTSLQIVGKLLGHTTTAVTERYAHVADRALREASDVMSQVVHENGASTAAEKAPEKKAPSRTRGRPAAQRKAQARPAGRTNTHRKAHHG